MAITSDAIGLLFKARGDTDEARKAFSDLRDGISKDVDAVEGKGKTGFASFAQSIGLSENAAGKLGTALPIVGAAAAAMGTAIVAAAVSGAKALFDLTQQAADFGSEIFDASQKTGLGAETLSALKFQAEQSGSSFEKVTGSVAKFNVILGEANQGSEKANATLAKYNITARSTDEALAQAVQAISAMTTADQRAVAAKELFKDKTAEILPVLASFNGDLKGTVARLKELGVTIGDDAASAADEFGDTMDTLTGQIAAVGRTIGFEFMPIFQSMASSLSSWLAANQGQIRQWAQNTADALRGTVSLWNELTAAAKRYYMQSTTETDRGILKKIGQYNLGTYLRNRGEAERVALGPEASGGLSGLPTDIAIPGGSGGGGGGGAKSAADKARREAEQRAVAELRAEIDIERDKLRDAEADFKKIAESIANAFKKTGDAKAYVAAADAALTAYRRTIEEVLPKLTELEDKQLAGAGPNALEGLRRAQEQRVSDLQAGITDSVDKVNASIVSSHEKAQAQLLKISERTEKEQAAIERRRLERWRQTETEIYEAEIANSDDKAAAVVRITQFLEEQAQFDRDYAISQFELEKALRAKEIEDTIKDEIKKREQLAALDEEYKLKALDAEEEFQRRRKEISDTYMVPSEDPGSEEPGGFFGGILDGLGTSVDKMLEKVEPLKGIGNIIGAQFNLMAQAVGNAVRAFVLFGSAGGSFRKFAAEVLASIAQMAVVQALWELAQWAAMTALFLFTGNASYALAAGAHLTAAIIYGAIGGVAALAGRAFAGDSFKNEAAGGYGTAGNTASTQERDTSGQGRAFSSAGDDPTIISTGINDADPGRKDEVLIKFKDDTSWFSQMFEMEYKTGGRLRSLVLSES